MRIFDNILHIFLPDICLSCENILTNQEKAICTICNHNLPFTNFSNKKNNLLEKSFYGRLKINDATALLFYRKKGIVQNLIYNLKYKGHQEIGILFGKWLSDNMIESNRFKNIDIIVPIPLHKNRLKTRGYNQVDKFGEQLALKLKTHYVKNILIRKSATKTQTHKQRTERWFNVSEIFSITDKSVFENKHILLIDDIITTGATIEACCNELLKCNNIEISIAVMAYTI